MMNHISKNLSVTEWHLLVKSWQVSGPSFVAYADKPMHVTGHDKI